MKMLMAAEEETFYEHIDEALHQYNKIFLSKGYSKFITNRFKGLSINKDGEALAGLAILLHDSGKSHFQYQANLKKPGIPHEAYSAALAWNALLLDENEKNIVAAAILLHHEYMRLPNPYNITGDFKGYIEELRSILREISLKHRLTHHLNLSKITALRSKDVSTVIRDLNRRLRKDKQFYVCTTLNLHPLVICDNLSAFLHRKGSPPRFLEDFEDPEITSVIQNYLKKVLKIT